jgi:hypothetical protein
VSACGTFEPNWGQPKCLLPEVRRTNAANTRMAESDPLRTSHDQLQHPSWWQQVSRSCLSRTLKTIPDVESAFFCVMTAGATRSGKQSTLIPALKKTRKILISEPRRIMVLLEFVADAG